MNKFSIAPWKTAHSHSHEYIRYVRDAQGEHIAHVLDLDDALAECTANARLIAAAPDLLAACVNMLTAADLGDLDSLANASIDARAAIARATGDQTITA